MGRETISYYDKNTADFIQTTQTIDFHEIQELFLSYLPKNASILDFGCGAGRDTKYFLDHGYQVCAIDGSVELCKAASTYTGICVKRMLFQDLDEQNRYDGIWACASILHLKKDELPEMLTKLCIALKAQGILYLSFKYGTFEGMRNGRYFTDLTEESFHALLDETGCFMQEKIWLTGDARENRGNEQWLNIILRRK